MNIGISAGVLALGLNYFRWHLASDYEETAKEKCPLQYHARSLCKKAHGEDSKCDDATYDLEVCVLGKIQDIQETTP